MGCQSGWPKAVSKASASKPHQTKAAGRTRPRVRANAVATPTLILHWRAMEIGWVHCHSKVPKTRSSAMALAPVTRNMKAPRIPANRAPLDGLAMTCPHSLSGAHLRTRKLRTQSPTRMPATSQGTTCRRSSLRMSCAVAACPSHRRPSHRSQAPVRAWRPGAEPPPAPPSRHSSRLNTRQLARVVAPR